MFLFKWVALNIPILRISCVLYKLPSRDYAGMINGNEM